MGKKSPPPSVPEIQDMELFELIREHARLFGRSLDLTSQIAALKRDSKPTSRLERQRHQIEKGVAAISAEIAIRYERSEDDRRVVLYKMMATVASAAIHAAETYKYSTREEDIDRAMTSLAVAVGTLESL